MRLEQVENAVAHISNQLQCPHSSADYYNLFTQLDSALKPLKELKETARSLEKCVGTRFKFLERVATLEGKTPALFGDLITLAVDHEVIEIRKEADGLKNSLLSESLLSVAAKVDSLKRHISTLCHDNALSQKNLMRIHRVEKFIGMVEKFLNTCETLSTRREDLTALQKARLDQAIHFIDMDPLSYELLMEIFEAAELFESNSPLAAKRKERLPVHLQQRLEVMKKGFEEELGKSSDHLYSPALLALALEMTHGKLENPLEEVARYYAGFEEIRRG